MGLSPTLLWSLGLVLSLGMLGAFWLIPWKISFSLQAQAAPAGTWALACGAEWRCLAFTGVIATGAPAQLQARLFGRKFWSHAALAPGGHADPAWTSRINRWLDRRQTRDAGSQSAEPLRLLGLLWDERARVAVSRLDIQARYSFSDVALTGRVLGALYMLTAVLPPQIAVDHAAVWDFEDRVVLHANGCIKVWVGRAALDVARYLVTNSRIFKKRAARGVAAS